MHREYLDEAIGRPGVVSLIWAQVESVRTLPEVAARIDAEFANTPEPTRTMSQKQLFTTFLGMLGDIRAIVGGLSLLVLVAVLFVTANAIALSVRERSGEVAILKALGFSAADVLVAILVESALVAALGGTFGCAVAFGLFRAHSFSIGFGPLSGFQIDPATAALGLAAAVVVGTLAALAPAAAAARRSVTVGLRRAD
jgi:putative ABC transport system permease protein